MGVQSKILRVVLWLALLAASLPAMQGTSEPAGNALRAGPVYTAARAAGVIPQFPDIQVMVETAVPGGAFRIRAGGEFYPATRVQSMTASGHAMAVAVVLDVSGSMKGEPLAAIRAGLLRFANDAGERDRIAIATVADESRWDVNWGDARAQIRTAINNLASRGKLTRLWDGLSDALVKFPEQPAARRVIVISDGHDEGSAHSLEELMAACQKQMVPIDAIGITGSDDVYFINLQRLAEGTGGHFRESKSEANLEQLVGGGIERLRSLPVVTFRLKDLRGDGKSHEFEVFWKHDGIESSAKVTGTVPLMKGPALDSGRAWMWAGGLAALALAIAGFVVNSRKNPKPAPEPAATRTPEPPLPEIALARAILPDVRPPIPAGIGNTAVEESTRRDIPQLSSPVTTRISPTPVSPTPVSPTPTDAAPPPQRSRTQVPARFTQPTMGGPAAWLLSEEGFGAGSWFPVDASEYWIGAHETNHLRITGDATVSRNHACIVFDTDVLGIFDYGSTNGTRVNGEIVQQSRRLLQPGDRIRVGRSVFVLRAPHERETAQ